MTCPLSSRARRARRSRGAHQLVKCIDRRMNHSPLPLLQVSNLTMHFPVRKGVFSRVVAHVHAVDDVSFTIAQGETLGLVGESGCGKSTTGRLILKLIEPTAGRVTWRGQHIDR